MFEVIIDASPWLSMYLASATFILGAIIGSFLNVVIYRFHTGKSHSGDSHCLSCLTPLRWYELFPLISYVTLKGRCRTCSSYIPSRYFVVELLTAISFLGLYLAEVSLPEGIILGILFSILIVIAVYDIYHLVIPNELVVATAVVAVLYQVTQLYQGMPTVALLWPLVAAVSAFGFYGGLWKMSDGRWIGFGDAKLAAPLGIIASWPAVFSMIVLSFWVGAAVSVALLVLQRVFGRGKTALRFWGATITMKSEVPFAPFLIIGFVLAAVFGVDVLTLISYVL